MIHMRAEILRVFSHSSALNEVRRIEKSWKEIFKSFKMNVFVTILLLYSLSTLVNSQNSPAENCSIQIICSSIKNMSWSSSTTSNMTCVADYSIKSTFSDASVSSVVHKNKSEVTNLAEFEGLFIYDATVKFIPS